MPPTLEQDRHDRNRDDPDLRRNLDIPRRGDSGIIRPAGDRESAAPGCNRLAAGEKPAAERANRQAIVRTSLDNPAQARPGDDWFTAHHQQKNTGTIPARLDALFPGERRQSATRGGSASRATETQALDARRDLAGLSTRTTRASCARGSA
jgi:hypothetical protein